MTQNSISLLSDMSANRLANQQHPKEEKQSARDIHLDLLYLKVIIKADFKRLC